MYVWGHDLKQTNDPFSSILFGAVFPDRAYMANFDLYKDEFFVEPEVIILTISDKTMGELYGPEVAFLYGSGSTANFQATVWDGTAKTLTTDEAQNMFDHLRDMGMIFVQLIYNDQDNYYNHLLDLYNKQVVAALKAAGVPEQALSEKILKKMSYIMDRRLFGAY